MAPPSTGAASEDDYDYCSACFLPAIATPIFQCEFGHVICSSCRVAEAWKCRVCRAEQATTVGYFRGRGRVEVWPDYYGHHAQCHCPAEGCLFAGSTAALLDHFAVSHGWPCITGAFTGASFDISLHEGINVVAVERGVAGDDSMYLLVMDVVRKPFGRVVSAFCIRPRDADADDPSFLRPSSRAPQCQVGLFYSRYVHGRRGLVRCHYQRTNTDVACTDLADGLPDPDDCFQAAVFNSVDQDNNEATVNVTVRVTIQ